MYLSILLTLGGVTNVTRFKHFLEVKHIVDSRNIITIIFGEIYKKLDLSPSPTWYPSVSKASINDEEVNLRW